MKFLTLIRKKTSSKRSDIFIQIISRHFCYKSTVIHKNELKTTMFLTPAQPVFGGAAGGRVSVVVIKRVCKSRGRGFESQSGILFSFLFQDIYI